jgi:hypothetical protein
MYQYVPVRTNLPDPSPVQPEGYYRIPDLELESSEFSLIAIMMNIQ